MRSDALTALAEAIGVDPTDDLAAPGVAEVLAHLEAAGFLLVNVTPPDEDERPPYRPTLSAERLARLPGWARDHVAMLEGDLEAWARHVTPAGDAPVVVLDHRRGDRPVGPVRTEVEFRPEVLDGRGALDVRLDPNGPGILVTARHGSLVVRPHVSNVVRCEVEPDA